MSEINISMRPVESSNIQAAGYDPATNTLRVEFKGGTRGQYKDVPLEAWLKWEQTFTDASVSSGSHFHNNIRNTYAYEKL